MSNQYFDQEVDDAIIKFQTSEDRQEREELCKDFILPAFKKLASYWYHKLPIYKNEEIIHDCVAYLYEKIPMFDASKGHRGFAYFNMITRHWYFQKLKSQKRRVVFDALRGSDLSSDISDLDVSEMRKKGDTKFDALIDDEFENTIEMREFILLLKEQLPKWKERATKEQEKKIIDALIVLFENTDNIDIYKKKAILHYLREITQMKPKQIALNLLKIKKKYLKFKASYLRGNV